MQAFETARPAQPRDADGGPRNDCLEAVSSEIIPPKQDLQALLPGRATLARQWPGLKVNRLTWRWVDDASGARGDDLQSLLTFLGEGSR